MANSKVDLDFLDLLNDHSSDMSNVDLDDNVVNFDRSPSEYYDLNSLSEYYRKTKMANKFSALHLNIQSLPSKFQSLKVMLSIFAESNLVFDCILICETFLTPCNNDLFNIEGYSFVSRHRTQMKGGGVCIYIRNTFNFTIRDDLSVFHEGIFESVFIEVTTKSKSIILGEIYRTPSSNKAETIQIFENIFDKLSAENKDIILATDQNIDYLDIENTHVQNLINISFASGILPSITKPTRVTTNSATLIDNIYASASRENKVVSGVLSHDISDHFPIFAFMHNKHENKNKVNYIEYRQFNDKGIETIKLLLSGVD